MTNIMYRSSSKSYHDIDLLDLFNFGQSLDIDVDGIVTEVDHLERVQAITVLQNHIEDVFVEQIVGSVDVAHSV